MEKPYQRRLCTEDFMDMSLITHRINDAVERFSKGGWVAGKEYPSRWRMLAALLDVSNARYQTARIGDIEVNAGTLAGRVMVTFQKGDTQVTVIGAEGEPQGGVGLQSIEASADEAVDILDAVIAGWNSANFKPNPKAMIV
jgi:hypothetical protein